MNLNITFVFRPGGNLFLNRGLSAASAGGVGAGGMLFNLLFPLGYNFLVYKQKVCFLYFYNKKTLLKALFSRCLRSDNLNDKRGSRGVAHVAISPRWSVK